MRQLKQYTWWSLLLHLWAGVLLSAVFNQGLSASPNSAPVRIAIVCLGFLVSFIIFGRMGESKTKTALLGLFYFVAYMAFYMLRGIVLFS